MYKRNLSLYHILSAHFSEGLKIRQFISRSRLFNENEVCCNPTQRIKCWRD